MRRVLYWFRTDLRLADSPALKVALDLKPTEFYPTWCWDPHYVFETRVGSNRWQFLLDSMNDVSESLTAINPLSKLLVVRGPPTTILPALFKQWGITDIVWEKDDDQYTRARDNSIADIASKAGVKVHVVLGHTLYDSDAIIAKGKGCPRVYSSFLKVVGTLPTPALPIPAPTSIPPPGLITVPFDRQNHSVTKWKNVDINYESRETGTTERDQSYESFAGPLGNFAVPTMEELGMVATSNIRGGEKKGLAIFEKFLEDEKRVAMFQKPLTSPAAFEPPSTTQLSPHLKFGTLSVRTFYHRVLAINKKYKGHSEPPQSLFFHGNQADTPHFGQIRGNPTSRYMSWHLQTKYDAAGNQLPRAEMEKMWKEEEPEAWEHFQAWKEGRTGFPWIDALMRQLVQTGWMHHLGRHSVACFLTRGQLYISWERGAEVFDQYLVDHDPAVNSGNWMWLSASAFFSQYFRVYSPITYGQKSDKTGALIRRFIPELSKLPDKQIYEPWKASPVDQKRLGCVLGVQYPERIVDEKAAKELCMKGLKAAYSFKIQGDDPRVLNGTADAVLATFSGAAELGAVKNEDDSDEEKPKKSPVKRKAPTKVPKAVDAKPSKQAKLAF
ncbi:cryptochrome, partial [Phenoliferia sp. Uapishka_3]